MWDKAKSLAVNWLLGGHVVGLVKRLNNYKTFLGLIVTAFGVYLQMRGGDIGWLSVLTHPLESAYTGVRLSDAEMVTLTGEIKTMIGAGHKIWKLIQNILTQTKNGLPPAKV